MKYRPILQSDSPHETPPWDQNSPGQVGHSPDNQSDITRLARTLAAHGGGAASLDLALDLILNEVVDEARRATGATGAAVALARADEMVCRASAGTDAPQLGDRFETHSGLSGWCLQTAKIQLCIDTETDSRVNAEACRRLGVRSILVMPLVEGGEVFGILEVFSRLPNAFGDREAGVLQVLAGRIVENKKVTKQGLAVLNSPDPQSSAVAREREILDQLREIAEPHVNSAVDKGSPERSVIWTSMLSILVIVLAVLLGLMVGWRGAIRGLAGGLRSQTHASVGKANQTAGLTSAPAHPALSTVDPGLPPKRPVPESSAEPPSGGLIVTENGKVIFREPPPTTSSSATARVRQPESAAGQGGPEGAPLTPAAQISEPDSTGRLIRSVEPDYPPQARTQRIQGAVVLDVQIAGDGTVRNVSSVSGDPVLSDAATKAVRQWRYQPYSVNGQPVEMQTRITIKFKLPPS